MDDAIENSVGQAGIADHLVPSVDRDLAGDQQGSPVVAIVDDFEQITALVGGELFRPPIIDDDEIGALQRGHQARQPAFTTRLGEIGDVRAAYNAFDIATLTSADFKPRLQDDFRLATPAGEIVLKLVEIRRLGHAMREGGAFSSRAGPIQTR